MSALDDLDAAQHARGHQAIRVATHWGLLTLPQQDGVRHCSPLLAQALDELQAANSKVEAVALAASGGGQ